MRSQNSPILVTGSHRSGTTWVGRILEQSGRVRYHYEPLNVIHEPEAGRPVIEHEYLYICDENARDYEAFLETLLYPGRALRG